MGFYEKRFDSIQVLRGIAAFSVILHHIAFIGKGAFGVDIFFCISGFIMMYITEINSEHFFMKRIIRLVPLYYAITAITFAGTVIMPGLFEKTTADLSGLIKSLLFIPFDSYGAVQPIVRVGWTLNYEMFFYLIVYISLLISKKYRSLIASGIIILLVVVGKAVDFYYAAFNFWTDSIMIEFIFGIISYEILRHTVSYYEKIKTPARVVLAVLAAFLYISLWTVDYNAVFAGSDRCVAYGIIGMVIFNLVFVSGYGLRMPKFFVWAGDISYSVYLLHYFIIRFYNRFLCPDQKADAAAVLGAVAAIVVVFVIGNFSYRLFEKKLNGVLRKKLRRNGLP